MKTVPEFLVPLVVGDLDDELRELLRPCGRVVGHRVELDLDAVSTAGREDLAVLLDAYWVDCHRFWAAYGNGEEAGPYVAIRREIARGVQRNTKTIKQDLPGHLEALEQLTGVGGLVSKMTDSAPDWDAIVVAGRPFGLTVSRDGDRTHTRFTLESAGPWEVALGGVSSIAEVRRHVSVRVEHAKWRDRRVRRLAEVIVEAEEIWPTPPRLLRAAPIEVGT